MLATYYHILRELVAFRSVDWALHSCDVSPSISTYLVKLLEEHWFVCQTVYGYGAPIVFWSFVHDESLPTCLFYWYYDVIGISAGAAWKHDPFSLYLGKDAIFWRGVVANKWQFLIHLLTLFDLIASNNLAYNIKILFTGGQQDSFDWFSRFVSDYTSHLSADFCFSSDWIFPFDSPCLYMACRWRLRIKTVLSTAISSSDLGLYAWLLPNPVYELSKMVSQLYDSQHRITLPYFYYGLHEPNIDLFLHQKKIKYSDVSLLQHAGARFVFKDKEYNILTQRWCRPALEVTSFSVYENDYDSYLPACASAIFDFQLVAWQTTQQVLSIFEQWIKTTLPSYVSSTISVLLAYEPIQQELTLPYLKKAERILSALYDKKVHYMYSGGGLPMLSALHHQLHLPFVLVPLADEGSNVSGDNEHFVIDLIEKWFQFSHAFFAKE